MAWKNKDSLKISQNNSIFLRFKKIKKKETLEKEINLKVTSRIF